METLFGSGSQKAQENSITIKKETEPKVSPEMHDL